MKEKKMAHDVFISYSSKDKPVTDGICANLEAAGVRCWIAPRDIAPGEDWPTAITKAISRNRIMVLVFSAYSNASDDVRRELILAVKNKLVIIPFKIENIDPEPGKQYYLESTHWLDAMNPPTKEQISTLIGRVKAILAVPENPPVRGTQPTTPPHLDPPESWDKSSTATTSGADNPHTSIGIYDKQLENARKIGDRGGEGAALSNLGNAYSKLGDAHKAIEMYEQALLIQREIGDRRGEGNVLGNLGIAFAAVDEPAKAIVFYEQALVIDREIGNRGGEGADLGNLGIAYAALGNAGKATEFYEKRMGIAREISDRVGEGNALSYLGNAMYQKGKKENGIGLMKKALAIYEKIESPSAEWVREKLKEWGAFD